MKHKEIEYQDISQLKFDPENPRIPRKIDREHESEVIKWMLKDASLIELMESIAINGFFSGEPLLAIKENGFYIIIEGNRRLAACKLLNKTVEVDFMKISVSEVVNSAPKINIPLELPLVVFDKKEEVLSYLGFKHVTGVKSWGSLAKARYLYELYKLNDSPKDKVFYKDLAKRIGSRSDYVKNLIVSYQLYLRIERNSFFKIKNLDDDNFEFSKLSDSSTRYSNITDYLGLELNTEDPLSNLNLESLENLTKWLFEKNSQNKTRVGDNRNIRVLNAIVGNERALNAFSNGKTLEEAKNLTSLPSEIMKGSITDALEKVKVAWQILPEVKKTDEGDTVIIKDILEYLRLLHKGIRDKIEAKNFDDFQL
jgi:hypothetical protein